MTSSPRAAVPRPGGRANQKERTRQALLVATRALPYAPGRSEKGGATRPALRVPLIDAVLESIADRMDARGRRRLRCALYAVVGAEAALSLKDVGGLGEEEIVSTLGWAAFQLAAAALGSPSRGPGVCVG
jgi:hypothetical protein